MPSLLLKREMFKYCQNENAKLRCFTLKVASLNEEDKLENEDFQMFRFLGFDIFDSNFLDSITVISPVQWKEIFKMHWQFGKTSFREFLAWFTDSKGPKNDNKSTFPSLLNLEATIRSCDESIFSMSFLRQINLLSIDLRIIASAIEFKDECLTMNFLDSFHLFGNGIFALFVHKVFEYFCSFQLKKLSISHLKSDLVDGEFLARLIESNSSSLVELILKNVFFRPFSTSVGKIHLPNIEVLIYTSCASEEFALQFTVGNRLKWLEGISFDSFNKPPNSKYASSSYIGLLGIRTSSEFIAFLKNNPHLECFASSKQGRLSYDSELPQVCRSMKHLKSFEYVLLDSFKKYIGSNSIEKLAFFQFKDQNIDWNFIMSLQRLEHLEIRNDFLNSYQFYEYLKLDRLKHLFISKSNFTKSEAQAFFETVRRLENLKFLGFRNCMVDKAVLCDSLEAISIELSGLALDVSQSSRTDDALSQYLPRCAGLKYLRIKCLNISTDYAFAGDLREIYPKLAKVKSIGVNLSFKGQYRVTDWREPHSDEIW